MIEALCYIFLSTKYLESQVCFISVAMCEGCVYLWGTTNFQVEQNFLCRIAWRTSVPLIDLKLRCWGNTVELF